MSDTDYDGGISDTEFLSIIDSIERVESELDVPTTPRRKPRKERASRAPRKRKAGGYNSQLSDEENEERSIVHSKALLRRRAKRNQRSVSPSVNRRRITDVVRMVERPISYSEVHRRVAEFPPVERVDSVPKGHGFTVERQNEMFLHVRRQGRSQTPEWLEVSDSDLHKFRKVSFLDGRYVGLEEHILPEYAKEFAEIDLVSSQDAQVCGRCPEKHHMVHACQVAETVEVVDMSRLFSFME